MILSYTLVNDFENCPRKAYHVRVAKDVKQEPTPEMARGIAVHEAFEKRLKDDKPLPPDLGQFEPFALTLRNLKVKPEYMLGMTENGHGCDFFAKDVWFRGKADVAVRAADRTSAWLLDWKTGKVREDPFELECQAMLLWANHPELAHIEANYYWLREARIGERHNLTPTRVQTTIRIGRLANEMRECQEKNHWPARPNPLCGWCPVWQCEHNKSGPRDFG